MHTCEDKDTAFPVAYKALTCFPVSSSQATAQAVSFRTSYWLPATEPALHMHLGPSVQNPLP